jgi:cytochrome c-type biogenesis protein CcmH
VIAFVGITAVMVAAALAWVLVPLLRGTSAGGIAREASNLAILRDQLAELETDLANGTIPRERYEQARGELEQRVLEESKATPGPGAPALSAAGAWTAAIVAGALPIASLLIYVALGNFDAFSPVARSAPSGGAEHEMSPQKVNAMAAELAAKLDKEPGNAEGWVMLARTYYSLSRHAEAARAFERAVVLVPDNADLLADYADALGAAQGGALSGKPLELVQRALAIDPTNWKALALAGTVAFDRKDYPQAVVYWERMKATVPPGSPIAQSIDASIAEARELGGLKAAAGATTPPSAPAPKAAAAAAVKAPAAAANASASIATGTTVAGTVKLSADLAAKAAPTDTVFIFARPAQGSKMPLAILRKQVKDLPAAFTLDDTMAMAPNMALSNFGEVVVGARISKSGQAMPQSGDLEGLSPPVKVGATGVAVVIERALP